MHSILLLIFNPIWQTHALTSKFTSPSLLIHFPASSTSFYLPHLSVAAYRGKHAALIMLSAKASKADLFARDHTSRTAFEILMEFHDSNMAASATATNDLVRLRTGHIRRQCVNTRWGLDWTIHFMASLKVFVGLLSGVVCDPAPARPVLSLVRCGVTTV